MSDIKHPEANTQVKKPKETEKPTIQSHTHQNGFNQLTKEQNSNQQLDQKQVKSQSLLTKASNGHSKQDVEELKHEIDHMQVVDHIQSQTTRQENSGFQSLQEDQSHTGHPDNFQQPQIMNPFFQRKRDAKGSYKAKFSLEKLIVEHEKKKIQIDLIRRKNEYYSKQLNELRVQAGKKIQSSHEEEAAKSSSKTHHEFLIKEMLWMQEDFDRERKQKIGDSKKQVRMCRRELQERKIKKEKQLKEMKVELRKKANNMAKMVGLYWKSVEKIVKHNYSVQFEKKRQQQRAKKLENFVSKHLKLSVKVAEELNTKGFVEQSKYNNTIEGQQDPSGPIESQQVKLYEAKDNFDSQDQQITSLAEQTVKMAELFKPTGTTLQTAKIATSVPFLLQNELREYQIIGLDWLVTLHNKRLNGILADEMGLGKTIQTIALLASLACDKGIWGPHLIVVPTTIIINWEMEFKRWCPGFKILTYFGSQKERKIKRQGWSKENAFHICITSYKLVIQDHFAFRRKKWYYMVLDEAQNIKNFKSQRWQTLLRFNTKRRLLLTGTPLQNDVMELWSLMHFLMPQIFSNQQDFKEWFSNPFSQSINQNQTLNLGVVQKLQSILRPFLLRRMKKDVEKQLPEKVEHIVQCNLSRRQRLLYDEYINNDRTQATLHDSDFFSIMNVLMQLRKVCNHPDLFESRTIESPFIMKNPIKFVCPSLVYNDLLSEELEKNPFKKVNLVNLNLIITKFENMSRLQADTMAELLPTRSLAQVVAELADYAPYELSHAPHMTQQRPNPNNFDTSMAESYKLATNCNVLFETNTQNLQLTVPKILQTQVSVNTICTNQKDKDFNHIHPNYLNVACLPFAQQYYSLDNFDTLRYPQHEDVTSATTPVYESSFSSQQSKQKLIQIGKKIVAFAHYDWLNRQNILNQRPIFGTNLRQAVKINLLLSSDLFDGPKKLNYVDRYSSQRIGSEKECAFVPSAVFNSFAKQVLAGEGKEWKHTGSFSSEFPEMTEEEIEKHNLNNNLVQEITERQQKVNKEQKIKRQEELKRQEEEKILRMKEELKQAQERAKQMEKEYRKKEKMETIEVEEQDEPGENGVILEINMKDIENEEQSERVKAYSLVKVQKLVPKDNQSEISEEDQDEEMIQAPDQEQIQQVEEDYVEPVEQIQQEEQKAEEQLDIEAQSEHSEEKSEESEDEEMKVENQPVEQKQNTPIEQAELEHFIGLRNTETLRDMITTPLQRVANLEELIRNYKCIIPKVYSQTPQFYPSQIDTKNQRDKAYEKFAYQRLLSRRNVQQSLKFSNILFFPHKNLIQYDCGKLQKLAQLLKTLYMKGSKVLIFTQMTRMLDVLEKFLNLHGYTYVRLDGSVKVEARQKMVDKFNLNPKVFCFISSTRCGGIGINLTGADCVIFYDTDWNPAMDKQAQDRSHRIGQTKTVHIYRLISVNTVEENIFRKSLQKREIGGLIIEGNFNAEFFKKVNMKDILENSDSLFKPTKRNIFEEENIVFHHNLTQSKSLTGKDDEGDLQREQEMEMYKKRFEEAMIRIEDEEDIEAYKEAKAEIDDEFEERDEITTDGKSEKAPEQIAEVQEDDGKKLSNEVQAKQQEAMDKKNAAGVSKDLKKSELIDWRNHPTLNAVTKVAIGQFENQFSYEDFIQEKHEQDIKSGKTVNVDEEEEDKESEVESEEEQMVVDWDRDMAEELYKQTRKELGQRLNI